MNSDTTPESGAAKFLGQPESQSEAAIDQVEARPGVQEFATRASGSNAERLSKGKLLVLGGGLMIAVLFFVFTAIGGKSSQKHVGGKSPLQQHQASQSIRQKGSVTPLMDTVHPAPLDNASGQIAPGDIRRTRSTQAGTPIAQTGPTDAPAARKPRSGRTLASIPSFEQTQQKWEDPAPYGETGSQPSAQAVSQLNTLKEPSLIFVRSIAQNTAGAPKTTTDGDLTPRLELTPGTRIAAKLDTQISSAVLMPVVAEVEYTYAIGERIVIPAGARVYGTLAQADRSGLVNIKFDEIEMLDGARVKIEAVGAGLDLGPIKGYVSGKNTGRNFLVRAASGIGSVLAEVAGNNTSGAFSEEDMLRERLAANIGTAGDTEVMSLNVNNRIVVSVPADTKIYIVFTKHVDSSTELRKVTSSGQ